MTECVRGSLRRFLLLMFLFGLFPGHADASKSVTYYYTDAQGSVLAIADASGAVISQSDYRPYGGAILSPVAAGPGFAGAVSEENEPLVYMQARYLDSDTGRFLSRDPIASEFNQYAYASNNPMLFRDPTGLYACNGNKDQCNRFESARSELKSIVATMQTSDPAKSQLVAVLNAYGTKDDGNNVNITFSESSTPAVTRLGDDGHATVNFDLRSLDEYVGPDGPGYSNKIEFAAAIAHEGQHVFDGKGTFDLSARSGVVLDEANAFLTQSYVNQAAGSTSRWGLWMPGYSPNDVKTEVVDNANRAADQICKLRTCK